MEISWTDRVKSKEELQGDKEERNTLHKINRKKDNWIGHILRRNRLLKYAIEEKREGGRQDDKEDVSSYWMTLRTREDTGELT